MRAAGVAPTAAAYRSAAHACAKQADGSLALVRKLLDEMRADGLMAEAPSAALAGVYNAALEACAKRPDGTFASAKALLDELLAASGGVDAAAAALTADGGGGGGKAGADDGAARVLAISFTNALARARDGSFREAKALLSAMAKASVPRDVAVFNAALSACAKQPDGSFRAAQALFDEMHAAGVERDAYSHAALLEACARHSDGSAKRARELLAASKRALNATAPRAPPNVAAAVHAIQAEARHRDGTALGALATLDALEAALPNGTAAPMSAYVQAIDANSKRRDGSAQLARRLISRVAGAGRELRRACLLYTSPSPRDRTRSRMPSSA